MVPVCSACPMKKICIAFKEGLVNHLPVKEKVLHKKQRWLYYFLFEVEGKLLVHKRTGKDIWQNLFEFYPFESTERIEWDDKKLKAWLNNQFSVKKYVVIDTSPQLSQQLTHQTIKGQFFRIGLKAVPKPLEHYHCVDQTKLKELAFPRFINQYLSTSVPGWW